MTPARFLTWGGYALALAVAPLVFTSSLSHQILSQIGIAIIACLSYNLLLGQGGMLSFGHAVYSGLGAFLAIHTLNAVGAGSLAVPVSLLPLAGGLAGLAVAVVFGWLTTRRAGTPFAMITLGVGELVWAGALMFPGVFGGEGGISGNRVAGARPWGISFGPQVQVYALVALYAFASTALMFAFTRTPLGRLLNAVRDNPERVEFLGYDPQVVRYLAFMASAFFAGISGGLAALNFEIVTADVLSAHRSGAYLLFTFLGGTTVFFGPIIGAVLMVLAYVLLSSLTKAWLLYLGLVFLLMVIYAPGGIASLVMAHLRVAAHRRWREVGPLWLGLAVAAATALGGAAALIEMVYHQQLDADLGPHTAFLGLALDASRAGTWLACALVMLAGLAVLEWVRRPLARRWAAIQHDIEQAERHQGGEGA